MRSQVTTLGETFDCGGYTIGFDAATGAITTLVQDATGVAWASAAHPLALLQYQTYNSTDVEAFIATYVKSSEDWAQHDYGKPNVVVGKPLSKTYPAQLQALYVKKNSASTSFLLQLSTGVYANAMAGGAQTFWSQVPPCSCAACLCRSCDPVQPMPCCRLMFPPPAARR